MWEVLKYLAFMALGGFLVHLAWLHSWKMYRKGKEEGRYPDGKPSIRDCPPPRPSVMIRNGGAK